MGGPRVTGAAAALLLGTLLAGAGGAPPPPARFDLELPVGMQFEVEVKQDFRGEVTLRRHGALHTRREDNRLDERYRVLVLAVRGGQPSKVEIAYLGAEASRAYQLQGRAEGHRYVVTAPVPGHPAPKVTENGLPVDPVMAHMVRGDALAVLASHAFEAALAKVTAHQGTAVTIPAKVINSALGAAGPQVVSAKLELVRVGGGRGLFMLTEHDRWEVGAVTMEGRVKGPEVVDSTNGRILWARISGTLEGRGVYLTRRGRARAHVKGRLKISVQFDYNVQ